MSFQTPPPRKVANVTPEEDESAGDEDSKQKELWRILVEEWGWTEHLARSCEKNGFARDLLDLEASGFKISEDDPLLLVNVDNSNPDSVGYANGGNYGINANTPGHLAWPGGGNAPVVGAALPPGVDHAPPNALAAFLRGMPDVEDKSGGNEAIFSQKLSECLLDPSDKSLRFGRNNTCWLEC